jgi:hypothetical protein
MNGVGASSALAESADQMYTLAPARRVMVCARRCAWRMTCSSSEPGSRSSCVLFLTCEPALARPSLAPSAARLCHLRSRSSLQAGRSSMISGARFEGCVWEWEGT